jgi:dephospho-CoA kinase
VAGSLTRRATIGLTGGIGSGKSTVGALLATLGADVVDTDAISRALCAAGGPAVEPIRLAFGSAFIDDTGALDRARMRELVFAEPSARHRLEAILHPMIGEETRRREAVSPAAAIVFDVPLLVESGHWRDRVQHIVVVDCEEATQVERVAARPGWSVAAARAVIAQQATRAARLACADSVIYNDGISLDALAATVRALWQDRLTRHT